MPPPASRSPPIFNTIAPVTNHQPPGDQHERWTASRRRRAQIQPRRPPRPQPRGANAHGHTRAAGGRRHRGRVPVRHVLIGTDLLSAKGFDRKDIPAIGDLLFRFMFKMTPEEKAACIAHGKEVYEAIKEQSNNDQTQSTAIKHPPPGTPATDSQSDITPRPKQLSFQKFRKFNDNQFGRRHPAFSIQRPASIHAYTRPARACHTALDLVARSARRGIRPATTPPPRVPSVEAWT